MVDLVETAHGHFGADTMPPAGLSTSGRRTLPAPPSAYSPPRVSKMTRSGVKLGGDLSPFMSEVLRPVPQGFVQEKRYEVPAARARYSKGRDTPSRASVASTSRTDMSHYAATKARLEKQRAWDDMHPHEFKRISRQARPTDRASMAGDKTLEEARTALERRRALEHEAVLAHLERVRVAAIEKDAAKIIERRARKMADIRADFEARRVANAETTARTLAWESRTASRRTVAHPERTAGRPMSPSSLLTRGIGNPTDHVVGPCAFVPKFGADAPKPPFEDERDAFADVDDAVEDCERRLGGVNPNATYAASFRDFARSHREAEAREGTRRTMSKREVLLAREAARDTERSLAELDDFDARVDYFHSTTLRERMEDRGWLEPRDGSRGTGGEVVRTPGGKTTLRVSNPPVSFSSPDF